MPNLSEAQRLLLRACCARESALRIAWEQWRSAVDLDTLDADSFRLIPLLYQALEKAGINDPLMSKLRGIARYHWAQAQVKLRAFAPTLGQLRPFDVLVLQGMGIPDSLIHDWYGWRVLIRAANAPVVVDALLQEGWRRGQDIETGRGGLIGGKRMRDPLGGLLEVCWCDSRREAVEKNIWGRAKTGIQGDLVMPRPSPLDALLFACLDDAIATESPLVALARVVDTARHVDGGIESDTVITRARAWDVETPVLETIGLLRSLWTA